MATIGDVARAAGVSRSTVSHALSGKRPISEATRSRIAQAISELNYTANARAKALATKRSSIMALMVPFTPEEFAPATMQYVLVIADTARSLGYDVLMVTEEEGAAGITRVTESDLVDGVILLDVKRQDARIGALIDSTKPGVLVGVPDVDVPFDVVDLDFAAAGEMLVRHLHEQGHREILFVTLPQTLFDEDLGYAWRFREAATSVARELGVVLRTLEGDADPASRAETIGDALDSRGSATALLVHNDGALADLRDILNVRRLEVPADISVVSLFPEQFGRMFSVPYTAIDTSAARVAAQAVRLLANRIAEPTAPVVRHLLAPVLVDRGTSGVR